MLDDGEDEGAVCAEPVLGELWAVGGTCGWEGAVWGAANIARLNASTTATVIAVVRIRLLGDEWESAIRGHRARPCALRYWPLGMSIWGSRLALP